MWIQSTLGAFSIVLADTEPGSSVPDMDTVMVRARRREHLENLRHAFPEMRAVEVLESPAHCDYRWRLVAPKEIVAGVVAGLVSSLGYRNFKKACASETRLDDRYKRALRPIWAALAHIQSDES